MRTGLRISVYRISPDGDRQDVQAEQQVDGDDYVPRYQAWPDCTCPRCTTHETPGQQAG